LPPITSAFIKIANVLIKRPNKDPFIKPFIIIGSEKCSKLFVLNQITFEIAYIFKFTNFEGGFTHAEVVGETVFKKGFKKGQFLIVATTTNLIWIVDLKEIGKYSKKNECKDNYHDSQEILLDTDKISVLLKIPADEIVRSMS